MAEPQGEVEGQLIRQVPEGYASPAQASASPTIVPTGQWETERPAARVAPQPSWDVPQAKEEERCTVVPSA